MFEFIKQRIEKNLIEEIGCLNSIMLEVVGHYMICAIEGKYLIHHGINKDYKPSGYTVDTFSSDSSIIENIVLKQNISRIVLLMI